MAYFEIPQQCLRRGVSPATACITRCRRRATSASSACAGAFRLRPGGRRVIRDGTTMSVQRSLVCDPRASHRAETAVALAQKLFTCDPSEGSLHGSYGNVCAETFVCDAMGILRNASAEVSSASARGASRGSIKPAQRLLVCDQGVSVSTRSARFSMSAQRLLVCDFTSATRGT